jgi:glyoxylase-like metal-dependent hydrolase (beta-lactamase superfamily II)
VTGPSQSTPGPAQAGPVVSALIDYGSGINAIDTDYVRPRLDASHLVVHEGRGAFVDTGTSHAVPALLAALGARGVALEAVDWVFLTHIHLDHAGGAGALLRHLPNARVVAHPRGAQHLADPARLIAATRSVYGDEIYERLYGEIAPVPAGRIVAAEEGLTLKLAGRPFTFLHTPGHALHHCVIVDREARALFSGDTFGVSYREFDVEGRAFVLPATTPTQFDPAQLHASVDRVLGERPDAVYMTHYGRVTEVARLGADMHAGIDAYVAIAQRHAGAPDRVARMRADMYAYLADVLDRHGFDTDVARRHELLDLDINLNVDGLTAWLERRAT